MNRIQSFKILHKSTYGGRSTKPLVESAGIAGQMPLQSNDYDERPECHDFNPPADGKKKTQSSSQHTRRSLHYRYAYQSMMLYFIIPLLVSGGRLCFRVVMNIWNMIEPSAAGAG